MPKHIKYKDTNLVFSKNKITIDSTSEEVMMDWEKPLMQKHAEIVCHNNGDVLEIGFGMGISADYIQALKPKTHTIIEMHPQIFEKLKTWAKGKKNVQIIFGDWYEVQNQLGLYDGIFFDTFSDDHVVSLKELVINTLKPNGKFTYFNPLQSKDQHLIDLYATYDIIDVDPPSNSYFNEKKYYLPTVDYKDIK